MQLIQRIRSILLRDGSQVLIDFRLCQDSELGIISGNNANLQLARLEVNGQHGRQTSNGQLNCLVELAILLLLQLLIQITVGLGLLGACRHGPVVANVSRRIGLVDAGSLLAVARHQDHGTAERPPNLRVLRVHVCYHAAEGIDRYLVTVLVLEVGGLVTRSLDLGLAVGDHPSHDTADAIGYMEDMGNGGCIQRLFVGLHFLLRREDGHVDTLDGHRRQTTLGDCLEGVLYLVEAADRRENRDVPVEAGAAAASRRVFRFGTDATCSSNKSQNYLSVCLPSVEN